MFGILVGILILDSFVLATAVLLQAGSGGGLASLGGGAGTETVMGGRQATTLLTKVTWWTAGIFLFLSLVLATAVLLQAGSGGGLASLGGGAGTETVMGGRQATTLLTKVTWWTAGIFLFLSLVLTFMSQSAAQPRSVLEGQGGAPAPVQQSPLPIETQPAAAPPAAPAAPAQPARPPYAPPRPPRTPTAAPTLQPAYALLEGGAWPPGPAPLPFEPAYAEVVFTTNLSGYQEVFTDPSYLGPIVVMTAPIDRKSTR